MKLAATIALAVTLVSVAPAQDITPAEKEKALQYLNSTRDSLADAVKGLSDAQWKFKPAPDRWSVAEVVEHLAVLEGLFANQISVQIMKSPAGNVDVTRVDAMILARVPDRSTKAHAPDVLVPTGRWTPQETLDRFLAARRQTVDFLTSSANLRGHAMNHPAFGPLDGYEWVLAIAAHTERHTKQILEVKADPHFPTN